MIAKAANIVVVQCPFFDLNLTGLQANMAKDLKRGDECIIATPNEAGDIVFSHFSFTHKRIMQNPTAGINVRVLFGKSIESKCLPKARAAKNGPYSAFFNVLGHFKRPSIIPQ